MGKQRSRERRKYCLGLRERYEKGEELTLSEYKSVHASYAGDMRVRRTKIEDLEENRMKEHEKARTLGYSLPVKMKEVEKLEKEIETMTSLHRGAVEKMREAERNVRRFRKKQLGEKEEKKKETVYVRTDRPIGDVTDYDASGKLTSRELISH